AERDYIARPGTSPSNRPSAVEGAKDGDRDRNPVGTGDVPTEQRDPGRVTFGTQATAEVEYPGFRSVRWRGETDQQTGGGGTHRFDVGDVHCNGLTSDRLGRRPLGPEMHALDQYVDRADQRRVDCDHGAVIARADQDVRSPRQAGRDLVDQSEL